MLPCLCHASPPAENVLACRHSAAVLVGLKAAKSIHVAHGGKFNTSGSSWPQPSKDRGATAFCPLHNIFTTQHGFNVKESSPWHQQQRGRAWPLLLRRN